jgi:hypothetical protein
MPKEFFTERDIENLFARGVTALELNDNVVLTEIAYEKARLLGLRLIHNRRDTSPSAAPAPTLSEKQNPAVTLVPLAPPANLLEGGPESKLHRRIRSAVLAKLGDQIDPILVDNIIKRVLASTGVK